MPKANVKPIGLIDALEQGDGFAHVAHWTRGTYIFIKGSEIWIHLATSGQEKSYGLNWKAISEIKYHPGKGLPQCENCKDADEIERVIVNTPLYEHFVVVATKMIKHLRSSDHCKCDGGS